MDINNMISVKQKSSESSDEDEEEEDASRKIILASCLEEKVIYHPRTIQTNLTNNPNSHISVLSQTGYPAVIVHVNDNTCINNFSQN